MKTVLCRGLVVATLIPVAAGLAACGGGGTATNSASLTSSVAPLDRTGGGTATGAAAAVTTTLTDQVAHEISSIPSQTPDYNTAQQALLSGLEKAGFKTDGVESELFSAASNYCVQPSNPWIAAIIGQLVTQGLVGLGADEAVTAFNNAVSQGGYCNGITPVSTAAEPTAK
ncbi:MAG: hypothetical protein Q3972_03860 [Corynebacterium sp.]|nr:hypothetical protein [Corynebacterium sp.]